MGLLGAGDFTDMMADIAEVISDHPQSIVLRRGDNPTVELAAQTVRIERKRTGSRQVESPNSEETRASIVIIGDTSLDIQIGDRFNAFGNLCRVRFVSPNQQIDTQAEADIIQ